jgi:hypothetical protein
MKRELIMRALELYNKKLVRLVDLFKILKRAGVSVQDTLELAMLYNEAIREANFIELVELKYHELKAQ